MARKSGRKSFVSQNWVGIDVLIGLGLTGLFINGKVGMWPLAVVVLLLEILGLIEDLPKEGDDV